MQTAWLIKRMNDVSEIDALSVSISQKKCKNWLGIFKLTAMDEHLAEFIASSVLTGIMTYTNWRLSAEMRLFSKIKKKEGMHVQARWRAEEKNDGRINRARLTFVSICCVGYAEHVLPWSSINSSLSRDI